MTRFLVTAEPTARLTTNPTLAGSCWCSASYRTSRWPTTRGLPARVPVRTASANSAPRRSRDWDGRIRHSAGRGPCACGRRGRRARPGCACAAGSHASSRGADCSAGTCACSLGLQVGVLTVLPQSAPFGPRRGFAGPAGGERRSPGARATAACRSRIHPRLPSGTPPFATRVPLPRLRLWKAVLPSCPGHGVQRGCHVHNMWIGLWIVSAARDGDARGAHR